MKKTLVIIDMNRGFCKEGALHDTRILDIVPEIIRYCESVPEDRRIFVSDAHEADAREFSDYPPHCLKGSAESAIIEELSAYIPKKTSLGIPALVEKNSTNAAWAMDLETLCNQSDEVMIVGCCTDICIMQFALSLQSYINHHQKACKLRVPEAAVSTFHIPDVHDALTYQSFALQIMKNAGISIQ